MANLEILNPRSLQEGISIINENPIDSVEKLGKYQLIYDYRRSFFDGIDINTFIYNPVSSLNQTNTFVKEPINPNSQIGVFSKGNIVNVLRFEGNNAVIENPNFVEPNPDEPKISFITSLGDLKKQKEFSIPKQYLRKVDDTLAVTVSTGILYGANPKPQPVYNQFPVKTIPFNPINQTILEENASFVLTKDFTYSEYISTCPPNANCITGGYYKQGILKSGTKVTGRLLRRENKIAYKMIANGITFPPYNDYLVVKGYGQSGSIQIPIEYLKREDSNDNGSVSNDGSMMPLNMNNKNILIIVGAFLVGYVLFNKSKSSK